MRYIVDSNNYVTAISFGTEMEYDDCVCTEYTGMVPYGWNSLEDWYFDEGDKLWRWKIVDGDLSLDASATAPTEGKWGTPVLQSKSVSPGQSAKTVKPDTGYDGLSSVKVSAAKLQSKSITPDSSAHTVRADSGYYGLSEVYVYAASGDGSGGIDTSDATAWPEHILSPYTAYVDGEKITGTMKEVSQPKPTITVDNGVITAGYSTNEGYTEGSVYRSATKTDANLIAGNIVEGVSIFGVAGTAKVPTLQGATFSASRQQIVTISGITELPRMMYIFSESVDHANGMVYSLFLSCNNSQQLFDITHGITGHGYDSSYGSYTYNAKEKVASYLDAWSNDAVAALTSSGLKITLADYLHFDGQYSVLILM